MPYLGKQPSEVSSVAVDTTTGTFSGEVAAASLDISGNVDVDGVLETDALSIASTTITSTAAELNIMDGVTATAAELNIMDGVTSTTVELNALDGITAVVGELNALDIGSTAVGTAVASKAVILDSSKDYTGIRNLTITGEIDAATGDFSGDVDVDGTLEADAITVNGTALATVIAGTTVTNATNSAHVLVTDNESTNEENLIAFVEGATSSTGNVGLEMDGNLAYNPSTGTVSATVFKGNIDAVDGDFDGTLEADAITIGGTAVGSIFSPIAGGTGILTTGALDTGSITSGFGTINNGASAITTTGVGTFGSLDISGDIDVDGTTNLDIVDIDGAVDMASTLQVDGAITSSAAATIAVTSAGAATAPLVLHNASSNANTDVRMYLAPCTTAADRPVILSAKNNGSNVVDFGISTPNGGTPIQRVTVAGSDGTIDVETGNIFFSTAGKGVYLGVTSATASNLLDDYEEGTWTPNLNDLSNTPTYHNLTGKYTKIGRQCTVQYFAQTNQAPTFNTTSGEFLVTGLPFTVLGSGYTGSQGIVNAQALYYHGGNNTQGVVGAASTGGCYLTAAVNANEHMYFQVTNSGGTRGIVNNVGAAQGFVIEATVTYFTSD